MKNLRTIAPISVFVSVVAACGPQSQLSLGHNNASGDDAGIADPSAAAQQNTVSDITCPYNWFPSPAAPLDACCMSGDPAICMTNARGNRPYVCTSDSSHCGCAMGVGLHRFYLSCDATNCDCVVDGSPKSFSGSLSECSKLDSDWLNTCGFPPPGTQSNSNDACPYGFTPESGNNSCDGSGTGIFIGETISSLADVPFSCVLGARGCGCTLTQGGHYYGLKCDASDECIVTDDGYLMLFRDGSPICENNDRARLVQIWNASDLPPQQ
jgi:hypothetical protein